MSIIQARVLGVLLAPAVLVACFGDSGGSSSTSTSTTPVVTPTVSLAIPFQALANATAVNCSATLPALGTTADSGKVSDFAFYVHEIQLKTNTGELIPVTLTDNDFQDPQYGVALLDFQDKADSCQGAAKTTHTSIQATATVNVSTVTGVQFIVGIPESINHHNASIARAPYNRAGLMWSWQSGHKFMRLDVNPTNKVTKADGSSVATFNFHLGSTGCTGDAVNGQVVSCTSANRPSICLSNFVVNAATNITSTVVLDYGKLIEGVSINYDAGNPIGCMSGANDPECPKMFNNLGLTLTTTAAPQQQVFSVSNN